MYSKVFAVTLNWNGKDNTVECVEALKKLHYPNHEIVVVDNHSTDGSQKVLKEIFPDITLIENDENLGYAKGFNTGINYAMEHGADYLFILNNDTKIDPEALFELVKVAETDRTIGFVSGKVYFYNEPNRLQTVGKAVHPITLVGGHIGAGEDDNGQYDEVKDYNFIDDVFLLVRREVVEKVGAYDPEFFLYYEETDWCARVRRAGFRIIFTPRAKIWHKGSMSTGGGTNSINTFYLARNRTLFIKKNGTSSQLFRFMMMLFFEDIPRTFVVYLVKCQWNLWGAKLKGVVSGLKWLIGYRGKDIIKN